MLGFAAGSGFFQSILVVVYGRQPANLKVRMTAPALF